MSVQVGDKLQVRINNQNVTAFIVDIRAESGDEFVPGDNTELVTRTVIMRLDDGTDREFEQFFSLDAEGWQNLTISDLEIALNNKLIHSGRQPREQGQHAARG